MYDQKTSKLHEFSHAVHQKGMQDNDKKQWIIYEIPPQLNLEQLEKSTINITGHQQCNEPCNLERKETCFAKVCGYWTLTEES